ncbi:hypothetical protein B0H10DRAFT_2023558 [Mycena sp. CBHHK59/15]|nr:hypothetical protein B0H10DRAFT_2023558 [Mycena sp. CBHHK59/15]
MDSLASCLELSSSSYPPNDSCYPQPPALFIQSSDSSNISSELSPLDEFKLGFDSDYNYSPSVSGRSSPIDVWSPVSTSSGDIFPDDYSCSDDLGTPWWNHQSAEPSGQSSPSLSPLTSAFDGFALDESYPDRSVLNGPGVTRLRSSSYSGGQNVSPAEVWPDVRSRSASLNARSHDSEFHRPGAPVAQGQGNFSQYNYSDNTDVQIEVSDVESTSLGTGMSWALSNNNTYLSPGDAASGGVMSFRGELSLSWKYPTERPGLTVPESLPQHHPQPPSPSLLTVPGVGLQRRGASRRTRSHSDLNSLMPSDRETGRGRGQHRAALSIPNSRSVSNGSRSHPSSNSPVSFSDVQTPASFSPHSQPSPAAAFDDAETGNEVGASVERRRTFTGALRTADEFLPAPTTLSRAASAPSSGKLTKAMRRIKASTGFQGVFKAEATDKSTFLSSQPPDGSQQEFRVTPAAAAATFKLTVASKKIRDASSKRRINAASFCCPFPNCSSTFTARHNLTNHINSHNKYRPHHCLCGLSFTTQGVLNRHKKRCRKPSA